MTRIHQTDGVVDYLKADYGLPYTEATKPIA